MAPTPLSSPVQAAQTHSRNLSGGSSRGTRRTRSESSEVSSLSDDPGAQHSHSPDLAPLLAEVPVYIVPAKLDVGELIERVEALGGERVLEPADARVVVTALRGRPRLERVLGKAVDTAAILRAEFIADAYERARAGGQSLPSWDDYRVHIRGPSIEPIEPSTPTSAVFPSRTPDTPTSRKRPADAVIHGSPGDVLSSPRPAKRAHTEHREGTSSPKPVAAPADLDTDVAPYPDDIPLGDIPRLACLRPSPLTCPNQDIIDAIKPIYLEREFDEMTQINTNVLSYRRSMAILKSVPRRIKSGAEARTLVDVGAKVANRIDEYLDTGEIVEAQEILRSERYQALQLFASVYSVGHATAAMLWRDGCRDLADVRAYFARHDRPPPTLDEEGAPDRATRREDRARYRRQMSGTMTREEIVDSWIDLKDELDQGIPRDEVDEIAACVAEHLAALSPGCEQTVTGGFRRGKASTGDVDVVFRPANAGGDVGLLKSLYMRMARFGIVTHVLQVTERVGGNPLTHSGANFDNLDKAFVILRLPSAPGKPARLHRRVDLICAPVERYAAAVLSWSGSMMFERDLRRWAEDRGYKFRAGVIHMATHREVHFDTEREIFHFLGLRYVPPTLRNADG